MNANNDWPGKPGVPPQDGVYWLKHNVVGDKQPCLYEKGKWYCCGSDIGLSPMQAAAGYSYLGPALTPDEAAALQKRVAELEAENAALRNNKTEEETLREMMRDPRYWRHRDPEWVNKVRDGFRKLIGEKDE